MPHMPTRDILDLPTIPKHQRRRLKGDDLKKRMDVCAEEAAKRHNAIKARDAATLTDARDAGFYLIEMHARMGRRSKWTKWANNQPKIAKWFRSASVYRQVASNWNDRRIVAIRDNGHEFSSIAEFLSVLQNKHPSQLAAKSIEECETDDMRRTMDKAFADWKRRLIPVEVATFNHYRDELLRKWHCDLAIKRYTADDEPHGIDAEAEETKQISRARTLCASNRGASSPWPRHSGT